MTIRVLVPRLSLRSNHWAQISERLRRICKRPVRLYLTSHLAASSLCLCASVVNKFLSKTNHKTQRHPTNQFATDFYGKANQYPNFRVVDA